MCDKTVEDKTYSLQYVPDSFVKQQQLKLWRDHTYWYHDDEMIKWCNGYKKRKAQ